MPFKRIILVFILVLSLFYFSPQNADAGTLFNGDGTYTFSSGDQVKLNNGLIIEPIDASTADFHRIKFKVFDSILNLLGTTDSIGVGSTSTTYEYNSQEFQVRVGGIGTNMGAWFATIYFSSTVVTISQPTVTDLTSNTATITYTVTNSTGSVPSVCYGPLMQGANTCVLAATLDPGNPFRARATLNGLTPGTVYAYKLVLNRGVSGQEFNDILYSFDTSVLTSTVTITSPAVGAQLTTGQSYHISWSSSGNILTTDVVDIQISKDGQDTEIKSWSDRFSATNEYYEWQVPANQTAGNYSIKLTVCRPDTTQNACAAVANDQSATFSIRAATVVTISQPTVTDLTSTTATITYAVTNSIGSIPSLCYGTLAQGTNTCVLAATLDPGNPFRARATLSDLNPNIQYVYKLVLNRGVSGQEYNDLQYSFNTPAAIRTVTITSPEAGAQLIPGQTYHIAWDRQGEILTTDDVDIKLSLNGQDTEIKSWSDRFSATNEYYEWHVPSNQPTGNYTIKLTVCRPDTAQNACVGVASDESEIFSIGASGSTPPVNQPLSDMEKIYQERIRQLEYHVSELEQRVTEQEKLLVLVVDRALVSRTQGRILLQVEENGEAWYVDPMTGKKYYLKDGPSAYVALNAFGLGITNEDIAKIPIGIEERFNESDTDNDGLADKLEIAIGSNPSVSDSDGDGYNDKTEILNGYNPVGSKFAYNNQLINRLKGRIVLQVSSQGQAWYINPVDGKRYYMKDGDQAYQIMRFLSLGITNQDLHKIPVGELVD